ncbi:RNA polymerase III subunit Rpc25-domain-containing protein [Blastocladiella britannica]|nr:RNA polymerase III subunit Rpc25-domain-containing protein [Blastocladiella britannica]
MFVLAEFADTVRVMPADLRKPRELAIEDEVNIKYGGRVFHNVGLCICMRDLLHVEQGIVQHTEGSAYYKVKFTMVVFRPFPSEVFFGTIIASSRDGIRVSTNFFDDIFVPPSLLPSPRRFDETDNVWVWQTENAELFFDVDEKVRVQVQSIEFKEIRPDAAKRDAGTGAVQRQQVPFKVVGDFSAPGLGPASWWEAIN